MMGNSSIDINFYTGYFLYLLGLNDVWKACI